MIGYALRRVLAALPLLWLIWTMTFVIGRAVPGDPMDLYESPNVSRESIENLRRAYGLDDPVPVQYLKQLGATLGGNLALSTSQGRPVSDVIKEALWPTLFLASLALLLQFFMGAVLGVLSALRHGRLTDHLIMAVSLFFFSMPAFWLGVELILLFSYQLGWLPPSHMQSIRAAPGGTGEQFLDLTRHTVLPLLTLGLGGTAVVIRHLRASMLEVTGQDYLRTARSRGVPEWRVVGRHALKNALMPLVTLIGLSLPMLLSGALLVEVVFAWPGLGRVAYHAILARDYPVVQATTIMTATLVVAGSLLADLLAPVVDPRVRLEGRR